MTLVQASAAAGVQIKQVGDGYAYPNGTSGPLGVIGDPVACVFADAGGPEIRTPQGFVLGQAVATLRSVYGSRLRYVPAGATSTQGVPSPPEYQVSDAQGSITFAVHKGYVAWMAAVALRATAEPDWPLRTRRVWRRRGVAKLAAAGTRRCDPAATDA